MKNILLKTVLFVLIIATSDFIIGKVLEKMYLTTHSKTIAKIQYTIDSTSQAILIYGSSRAQHHYIPDSITKNTGLSCYNCGIGGQGLAFTFCQITEMLKRHRPQVILLDISPNILIDSKSEEKLRILMPYYKRDTLIYNAITSNNMFEKLKYNSSIFPYNGNILPLLISFIHHDKDRDKGYIPLFGQLDPSTIKNDTSTTGIRSIQLYYMNRIISIASIKNVKLILVVSPIYKKNPNDYKILAQIKEIANKNNLEYIDSSADSSLINVNYFKDNLHLNTKGAALYSKEICRKLF